MLKFYYGTMNSGKSLSLLTSSYQLEERGKKVVYFKPSKDTRQTMIESRLGVKQEAISVGPEFNIFEYISKMIEADKVIDFIFCDEIQFFERHHISELRKIADSFDIEVRTYGLKNSYVEGELFEAIKVLMYEADTIIEIESFCEFCKEKATHHLRIVNGQPVRHGNAVKVGDVNKSEDYYISCCRRHYHTYENIK